MRTAFGVFLVLHALVHVAWLAPKPNDPSYPFRIDSSPLLPGASESLVRGLGQGLAVAALLAFVLAGLGVLGVPGLAAAWKIAAVVGAVASLALVAVFWDKYFVAGPILNTGILVAVYMGWPDT
jgi:hypothetical protein